MNVMAQLQYWWEVFERVGRRAGGRVGGRVGRLVGRPRMSRGGERVGRGGREGGLTDNVIGNI